MQHDTLKLVDVNVIVDAAQTIYRAWDACRPLMALTSNQRHADNFTSPATASATLEQAGYHSLAEQVATGRIPLELLQARAAGNTLSRSVSSQPPPPWLRQALLNHSDTRVRDLAHAADSGTLIMSTYILSTAQAITASRPIHQEDTTSKPGHVPVADAVNLIHALTHGGHLISMPDDLNEVIAAGALDDILEEAREHAGEHLAAFPQNDPYWRTPKDLVQQANAARQPHMTWREHKARIPDAYGIDGDDLYLLRQARYLSEKLGRTVGLITSDYHLAMAAAKLTVPSRLYSYSPEHEEIRALDIQPHPPTTTRHITVPSLASGTREATHNHQKAATPSGSTRRTGPVNARF